MPKNIEKHKLLDRHRTPARLSPEVKQKSNPIIEPKTRVKKDEDVGQTSPDQNAMIIEQIDGCCKMMYGLFEQLTPKTTDVIDCEQTLKAWQDNNFKHLKGAFE